MFIYYLCNQMIFNNYVTRLLLGIVFSPSWQSGFCLPGMHVPGQLPLTLLQSTSQLQLERQPGPNDPGQTVIMKQ